MDFTPTEAQLDLARLTGEVCGKLVTADRLRELDRAAVRFDEPLWTSLAETGVLAAALPEAVGGNDFGTLEQSTILRELGRHVAAVPYLWSVVLGAGALAAFGDDAQRDWAIRAGAGSAILTVALAEELNWDPTKPTTTAVEGGDLSSDLQAVASGAVSSDLQAVASGAVSSDLQAVASGAVSSDLQAVASGAVSSDLQAVASGAVSSDLQAVASGGSWRVTGAKLAVPVAAQAARILVPATISGRVAVFLVDPSDASIQLAAQQVTDLSAEYSLEFTDTPAELVGTVDNGAEILDWLLIRAWLGLSSQQLGTVERALELVAEYGREREQFGKSIGSFQAVAQRLADAYIDVQGLRLAVTQAAWQLSEGLPSAEAVHTAKFWAADAGHRVAHTVVHVHGGVGIDRDHIVHNYFTAAKHNEFALGGATDHLRAIGSLLAETPP